MQIVSLSPDKRVRCARLTRRLTMLACTVALTLAVLLQMLSGAWKAEFGGYPDEPAHFITGLMIRDYIISGFHKSPLTFAEDYYLHYPKVAFGMWGPLFHICEAVFMLVLPPSHGAVLLLTASVTAATAVVLFRTMLDEFGILTSSTVAAIFICTPTVQQLTGMAMADGLVALLDFCAALQFAKYLRSGLTKDSLMFGLFACLSILAKGNGVALILLPVIAVICLRSFGLFASSSFWAGAAVIAAIAGPWQYYSARMLNGILIRESGWGATPYYFRCLYEIAGVLILLFTIVGLASRIVLRWRTRTVEPKWASAAALLVSVFCFHCLIPNTGGDIRYFIALVPPMLMFAAAGLRDLLEIFYMRLPAPVISIAVSVILATSFSFLSFRIPKKTYFGFDVIANELERPKYKNSIILVSSEAEGEGLLISEMALREVRPGHILLRATKMLGQADWNGQRYLLLHKTPVELLAWLKSIPVDIVVLDRTQFYKTPHQELLAKTIATLPEAFDLVGTYPNAGLSKGLVSIYRVRGVASRAHSPIRIELPFTLGHPIESK